MQDAIPSHNHFHYCLHILTVNHNWMQCVMRRSTDDYKLARLDGKKQVFLELRTPYISHWQRRGLCCTLVNQIGFPDSPLQFLWKRGFDETGKALLFEGKHGWTYLLSDFPSWTTATKHWSRLKFSCIFDLFATEFVFMCFLYLYSCVCVLLLSPVGVVSFFQLCAIPLNQPGVGNLKILAKWRTHWTNLNKLSKN